MVVGFRARLAAPEICRALRCGEVGTHHLWEMLFQSRHVPLDGRAHRRGNVRLLLLRGKNWRRGRDSNLRGPNTEELL